jgi:glutaredoxin
VTATLKAYITGWCPDCRRALRFLDEHGIAHEDIDVDESEEAEALVLRVNNGRRVVPTFEVDGRFFACSPYKKELLAAEVKELLKS